jgi:hypothetical protein
MRVLYSLCMVLCVSFLGSRAEAMETNWGDANGSKSGDGQAEDLEAMEQRLASLRQLAQAVGLFACMNKQCSRIFGTRSALGRHHQASGHSPYNFPLPDTQLIRRHRYTFREKRALILDCLEWARKEGGDEHKGRQHVSQRTGIRNDLLRKWMREREEIFRHAGTRRRGGSSSYVQKFGEWHEEEVQLYIKFIYRRRYQGLRVTRKWLQRNFKYTRAEAGHNVDGWFPSQGWCTRFCKRWEITSQCRTNKKKYSIEERLPKIQGFHQYWILSVQSTGEQRCPKYGRYPPSHIFTMDQVPMPFSSPSKRSMNEKGAPRGNRFTAASEDDKRFCTIQVTLCADNVNTVPVELIFASDSGGEAMSQEEKDFYKAYPNIKVRWQSKAWADEPICIDYIVDLREHTIDKGSIALIMDNHSAQSTPRIQNIMQHFEINYVYTPAGCTDCVSPIDRNVGQWLKERVYRYQDEELDIPENRNWALPSKHGGLTKKEKRMHVVRWMSMAWEDLKRERPGLLNAAWVQSGCLVAKDGSENHLIKLYPNQPAGAYNYI